MATHSSIHAWEIPRTEVPDGLQSMGSQELDTTQRLNFFKWKCYLLSRVGLFATPGTIVCQAPLSMEFSRQEYWSG